MKENDACFYENLTGGRMEEIRVMVNSVGPAFQNNEVVINVL